jgi:hypothetical protein
MAVSRSETGELRATGRSAATVGSAEPSSKHAPTAPIGTILDITLRYLCRIQTPNTAIDPKSTR